MSVAVRRHSTCYEVPRTLCHMRRRYAVLRKAQRAPGLLAAVAAAAALTVGISPAAVAMPTAPASIGGRVPAAAAATFRYLRSFGSGNGMQSGPGQFSTPGGAGFAPSSGDLFVTDRMNNRVQEFWPSGKFRRAFGHEGSAHGQFRNPYGLGVNRAGDIYVADEVNNRVQEFSPKRAFIRAFGQSRFVDGPTDLAVAPDGDVYVADGPFIRHFTGTGHFVGTFGGTGRGPGQFNDIVPGLATGPRGHVWAGDFSGARVEEFTGAGVFIRSVASSGKATVQGPVGVTITKTRHIVISDNGHERALELYPDGRLQRVFGTTGKGKLDNPGPAAVDCADNVYVLDTDIGRVREYGNPHAKRPPC
jgi:DNA-binding beta-propeller fold protein YncE